MLELLIGPKFNILIAMQDMHYSIHISLKCIHAFFVRLNFAFKIFVVKNFRQYFVFKFFREEKF